jgi:hypothetical protein
MFSGSCSIMECENPYSKAIHFASKLMCATSYSLIIFMTGYSELNSMLWGVLFVEDYAFTLCSGKLLSIKWC